MSNATRRTAKTIAAIVPAPVGKHIQYDRATKDYYAALDGAFVGYFRSYNEAEAELDRLALLDAVANGLLDATAITDSTGAAELAEQTLQDAADTADAAAAYAESTGGAEAHVTIRMERVEPLRPEVQPERELFVSADGDLVVVRDTHHTDRNRTRSWRRTYRNVTPSSRARVQRLIAEHRFTFAMAPIGCGWWRIPGALRSEMTAAGARFVASGVAAVMVASAPTHSGEPMKAPDACGACGAGIDYEGLCQCAAAEVECDLCNEVFTPTATTMAIRIIEADGPDGRAESTAYACGVCMAV